MIGCLNIHTFAYQVDRKLRKCMLFLQRKEYDKFIHTHIHTYIFIYTHLYAFTIKEYGRLSCRLFLYSAPGVHILHFGRKRKTAALFLALCFLSQFTDMYALLLYAMLFLCNDIENVANLAKRLFSFLVFVCMPECLHSSPFRDFSLPVKEESMKELPFSVILFIVALQVLMTCVPTQHLFCLYLFRSRKAVGFWRKPFLFYFLFQTK